MNNDMVQQLFVNLSKRLDSENNLSDVTWAVSETIPEFKIIFIEFFFGQIIGNFTDIVLEREYHENECRPDFHFMHDKKKYIIEVKKYDYNDHFVQYLNQFPDAEIGWIANYQKPLHTDTRLHIRTWNCFYQCLIKKLQNNSFDVGVEIIKSYCAYLKSVCAIINLKEMKLENLTSLFYFGKVVEEIIDSGNNPIICKKYDSAIAKGENWYGSSFTFDSENPNSNIFPWFGIVFDESVPWIAVSFSRKSGGEIYKRFKDGATSYEGNFVGKPEFANDNSELYFKLKNEHFSNLNSQLEIDKQKELLRNYFMEVLNMVKGSIIR